MGKEQDFEAGISDFSLEVCGTLLLTPESNHKAQLWTLYSFLESTCN